MPTYHLLNGDCLAEQLKETNLQGEAIIFRECLVEGNLAANDLNEFWQTRATYLSETYEVPVDTYFSKTVAEFEKLHAVPDHSEVCLWFEHDLFCQVNRWFVLAILAERTNLQVFSVDPPLKDGVHTWEGFGVATAAGLQAAYASRQQLTTEDLQLGADLWAAFQQQVLAALKALSTSKSPNFPFLESVVQAHLDRFPTDQNLGRPERAVKAILNGQNLPFETVFSEFSQREGIYGFSDLQIKKIYNQHINRH